jgi:16S rRNA (cytosine967-C5)-methyltransferase
MSRYYSYLTSAATILEKYTGEEPFVHFARKQFAANKKFGSRDRKTIASLCYSYFRVSHLFKNDPLQERILKGVFLCETAESPVLAALKPDWNTMINLDAAEKLNYLSGSSSALFPFGDELTGTIDQHAFSLSFLRQPLLFLRVRPGKISKVLTALDGAGIAYDQKEGECLALANATALDKVLRLNKDVVVQDLNSQKVFSGVRFDKYLTEAGDLPEAWDCCAASGGKSLLLYDKLNKRLKLTVSDIRSSILANLKARLQEAGVPLYKTFIADLTVATPTGTLKFDIIICDAPCTGSGTWSRTPEQLAYFKRESIAAYSQKQQKIAANASGLLARNGLFFYITCSVFKKENEEVVSYLQENCGLELINMQYLEGYQMQADTMFVAVFKQSLPDIQVAGNK